MKTEYIMKKTVSRLLPLYSRDLVLLIILLISGCKEDPDIWEVDTVQQVISEYVAENPDFSEFNTILLTTGLNSLLSVRGPFTLFLPTNTAMEAYYEDHGIASSAEMSVDDQKDLALNHLVSLRLETNDFGLGAITELNALGDYLVTEFVESDIILNKQSLIIKRNISAANGVIHHIDKVIEPVTLSVFELLEASPSYSMFTEGLIRTGLKDTLNTIQFPYGQKMARTRFTLLAVADTTFQRYGIQDIDQLVAYFTDAPDSITFLENGFYRYMEYHCLGGTYYLNQFDTRVFPILSYDNNVDVRIAEDYKLNLQVQTGKYTGFYIEESNYPAKNGTVHTINDLLPVFQPAPT
ncbi:MAG: fasciclin domain-containing protein, partial [Bacteroidetes bacterium]